MSAQVGQEVRRHGPQSGGRVVVPLDRVDVRADRLVAEGDDSDVHATEHGHRVGPVELPGAVNGRALGPGEFLAQPLRPVADDGERHARVAGERLEERPVEPAAAEVPAVHGAHATGRQPVRGRLPREHVQRAPVADERDLPRAAGERAIDEGRGRARDELRSVEERLLVVRRGREVA